MSFDRALFQSNHRVPQNRRTRDWTLLYFSKSRMTSAHLNNLRKENHQKSNTLLRLGLSRRSKPKVYIQRSSTNSDRQKSPPLALSSQSPPIKLLAFEYFPIECEQNKPSYANTRVIKIESRTGRTHCLTTPTLTVLGKSRLRFFHRIIPTQSQLLVCLDMKP